jgi:hypothetical protein
MHSRSRTRTVARQRRRRAAEDGLEAALLVQLLHDVDGAVVRRARAALALQLRVR